MDSTLYLPYSAKVKSRRCIFGRDILFDIPYIAYWNKIGEYIQAQTDRKLQRKNASRVDYDYAVGGKVLFRNEGILRKSEAKYTGPYTITAVHKNCTIRIQKEALSERLNIRRVKPYSRLESDGTDDVDDIEEID